jgi:hypothetical protein
MPLLEQFDWGCLRLINRMTGPESDSDVEEMFIDIVWWVNQEVLHHGAEIALLRDLYRYRARQG